MEIDKIRRRTDILPDALLEGATVMRGKGGWKKVYRFVKRIPRGRLITYGRLAKALRLRGGARTAGHAIAACPSGQGIPWHRVVGAGGKILPREPYAGLQRRLLESEGVGFAGHAADLAAHLWRPGQAGKQASPRGRTSKTRSRNRRAV